ncbi:MAG: peroxidase-related enzyme [Bryobacterales bacterium]|nr:peroxidase-related enzyme [Bryobacterales bacterium]
MSYLRESTFANPASLAIHATLEFGPNLFQAQALLPRLIEAEAQLLSAIAFREIALSQLQKERIFLIAAAVYGDRYFLTLHWERLRARGMTDFQVESWLSGNRAAGGMAADEAALADFSLRLNRDPLAINSTHIDQLRKAGFEDGAILEAVLANALGKMLCTAAAGLAPPCDFEPRDASVAPVSEVQASSQSRGDPRSGIETKHPYLSSPELHAADFEPFAFLERRLGVIPNLFRAQTLRPDVIEAETRAAELIVANEEVLPQSTKESILLVNAAANLNSYCVAAHCAMLRRLGLPPEETDQIAVDHHQAGLPDDQVALLDFTRKLGLRPGKVEREDLDRLRERGFSEAQILESVVTTGFGNFLNVLVAGLGVVPDFEPRLVLQRQDRQGSTVIPSADESPDRDVKPEDPDIGLVSRVQAGDMGAFEDLVRRHEQRVYRTVIAILRDPEAAQDAVQDAFLKAFKHIRAFQGRSKFVTWLMTISRNAAIQLLRDREETESLDDGGQDQEDYRPRQVRGWQDNPEELYTRAEMRELVEREILKLPSKYRVVIMLRDIEQLSATEVCDVLGLSLAAVKARLFRARMMLRDALAPRFAVSGGRLDT